MVLNRPMQLFFLLTTVIFVGRTKLYVSGYSSRRNIILGSGGAGLLLSSASDNNSMKMSVSASVPRKTIRWGIVGLGDVTQVKSGPPFWKCQGSELAAVMRRTPGKAAEFAARVPTKEGQMGCVGYDNLEKFLEHPGLEAVYIATRPGTHSEIAKKVAEAGLACYIEKPVGRCSAETIELSEAFNRKGLPLYTAYISRANERTQTLRQLIKEGVIGNKLLRVNYVLRGTGGARDMTIKELPWRLDAIQSGGGLIMDVGCHVLDRIDYLCGPLQQVKGSAEHRQPKPTDDKSRVDGIEVLVENYCQVTAVTGPSPWAAMPNGGCEGATIDLSWDFSCNDENDAMDELVFVGSNGRSLKMAGMSPNGPIDVVDKDGSTILESFTFDAPEHTAQRLIQAVTNDLIDRKNRPQNIPQQSSEVLSFGENAIRTQKVIDAMLDSYYGGREIGYWSRVDSWPGNPTRNNRKG